VEWTLELEEAVSARMVVTRKRYFPGDVPEDARIPE
jgi:hypothetical protein